MRAAVVGRTLNSFGIDTHRLLVTGYGDQYPIADNVTEEGRAQNRRVSIVISVNRDAPRLMNPGLDQEPHSVVMGTKKEIK